jgi:hypothetical protein
MWSFRLAFGARMRSHPVKILLFPNTVQPSSSNLTEISNKLQGHFCGALWKSLTDQASWANQATHQRGNALQISHQHKQHRQCTSDVTVRHVCETIVAVEYKNIFWVCVYSLMYPACTAHEPHSIVTASDNTATRPTSDARSSRHLSYQNCLEKDQQNLP